MISVILDNNMPSQRCHPKASELLLALPLLPLETSMPRWSPMESCFSTEIRPTAAETQVFLPKVSAGRGLEKTTNTRIVCDWPWSLDQELATFWRQRLSVHEADIWCSMVTLGFITRCANIRLQPLRGTYFYAMFTSGHRTS